MSEQISILGDALAFNQATWDWFTEKAKAAGYPSVVLRVYELVATGEPVGGSPPATPPPPTTTPPPVVVPPPSNWWESLAEGVRLRVVNPAGAVRWNDPPVDKPDANRFDYRPAGDTSMQVKRGDDGRCNHGPYILVQKWPPHNLWVNAADVAIER